MDERGDIPSELPWAHGKAGLISRSKQTHVSGWMETEEG